MKKLIGWLMAGLLLLMGSQSQPVQAADNSVEAVKAKGTLVMGTSPDYAPYEFLVNKNGKNQVVGMDVLVAQQVAKDLGVKLVIKQMDFDGLLVGLQSGKLDMVMSALTPTTERKQSVAMTDVYYKAGQYLIINKADAGKYKRRQDVLGQTIGVQIGTLQAQLAKDQMSASPRVTLQKLTELVMALKSHKVAAVLTEEPVAKAYAQNDSSLAVINTHFDLSDDQAGVAIGFAKGADGLVQSANATIARLKQTNQLPAYLKQAGALMAQNTADTSMLHYWRYFAKGVGYTVLITVIAVVIGVALGALLAMMRLGASKLLKLLASAYIEFVRGTPLMIQVMFVYFGLGIFIEIPALTAGIIAVALNSGAYVAEVIRGGIVSVAQGQSEAARSLGLSKQATMRYVVFPQALRNIWPALGNEFISLIKESSIVSIIGVTDLIYQLKVVQTSTYKGVQPIFIAMVLYFIMTFSLSQVLKHYEAKMNH